MLKDITKDFFDGNVLTDAKRIRQLKDNLCGYLKSLNIGTANCENDARPELKTSKFLKGLKASDTYRSKVMHQARYDLITGPCPKRPKWHSNDDNSNNIGDDEAEPEPDVDMTKKESRSRSTLAIEAIANNSLTQTTLQDKFFKDQSEKHELLKKLQSSKRD